MQSIEELNPHKFEADLKTQCQLMQLYEKLTKLQSAYIDDGGNPFVITSGLRSYAYQNSLIEKGVSNAPKSRHLLGCAADILDHDGALGVWLITKGAAIMKELDLYGEDLESIRKLARKLIKKPWVHLQTLPPASGKRWFIP